MCDYCNDTQNKRDEIEKLYDTFTFPSEQKEKVMNDKQLLEFFDIHKNGQIDIRHAWTEKLYNANISLEDLFEMFRLWLIRRDNAVTQD